MTNNIENLVDMIIGRALSVPGEAAVDLTTCSRVAGGITLADGTHVPGKVLCDGNHDSNCEASKDPKWPPSKTRKVVVYFSAFLIGLSMALPAQAERIKDMVPSIKDIDCLYSMRTIVDATEGKYSDKRPWYERELKYKVPYLLGRGLAQGSNVLTAVGVTAIRNRR